MQRRSGRAFSKVFLRYLLFTISHDIDRDYWKFLLTETPSRPLFQIGLVAVQYGAELG